MESKVIELNNQSHYRIVAISDVHGHKGHLEKLIERLSLAHDDVLIILGDFLNRGIDSFEMYTYIRQLEMRENTYILKGNHEWFMEKAMTNFGRSDELLSFLKEDYYETLIATLAKKSNIDIQTVKDSEGLLRFLVDEYQDIVNYLRDLPIMVKIDNLTFVHGGTDPKFDVKKDEIKFLKYDEYNTKGKPNAGKVIVGHWPTSNLRTTLLTNAPYFNDDKNIIFIDGGLGVKKTGELNAFVVEKSDAHQTFNWIQENGFESRQIIKKHIFKTEELVYVNYPHYDFEVLTEGNEMTLCRHEKTGKSFSVFNGLLVRQNGRFALKMDYINRFFNIEIGETVEVCRSFEDCHLVKYNGEFGWIKQNQI